MKTSFCLLRISIFLLLILISNVSCQGQSEEKDKPNILLIFCDDLNDSVEGMGGHPQAITPNLTRLAKEGVRFTNAHSADPICGPSRASFYMIPPKTSNDRMGKMGFLFVENYRNRLIRDCTNN